MKNTLKFVTIMTVGFMLGTASCDNDDDRVINEIDTTGTPGIDTTGSDTIPGTDTTGTDTTGFPIDTTGIDTTGTPGIDTSLINSLQKR